MTQPFDWLSMTFQDLGLIPWLSRPRGTFEFKIPWMMTMTFLDLYSVTLGTVWGGSSLFSLGSSQSSLSILIQFAFQVPIHCLFPLPSNYVSILHVLPVRSPYTLTSIQIWPSYSQISKQEKGNTQLSRQNYHKRRTVTSLTIYRVGQKK